MDDGKMLIDIKEYKMLVGEQARLNAIVDYIMFTSDGYPDVNTILVMAGNFDEAIALKRKKYERLETVTNED